MADQKQIHAEQVYQSICDCLNEHNLKYTRHDDELVISLGMQGEDIPMDFLFFVKASSEVVTLLSPLPFKVSEDKRVDAALAVCVANDGLVNGSFDYDLRDGSIRFRMVSCFKDNTVLDKEVFFYMLLAANYTVDKYNDRFLMLSKGMIDLSKFMDLENQDN